jgi:hypothetical protein
MASRAFLQLQLTFEAFHQFASSLESLELFEHVSSSLDVLPRSHNPVADVLESSHMLESVDLAKAREVRDRIRAIDGREGRVGMSKQRKEDKRDERSDLSRWQKEAAGYRLECTYPSTTGSGRP